MKLRYLKYRINVGLNSGVNKGYFIDLHLTYAFLIIGNCLPTMAERRIENPEEEA